MRWTSVLTGQARTVSSTQKLATPNAMRLSFDSTKSRRTPATAVNQIVGGSQHRLITNSTRTPKMLPARLSP
jgi:hypothetical protein